MGLKAKPRGSSVVELGFHEVGLESNKKINVYLSGK
jgi:hypothetical protein